ncbi:Uncharacterised protein [Mycobacteroides abscessus subsp. abscessus]|nr:Uncharacterised protein [Mycobacteroides abscessus subsp. abscessus]
MRSTAPTTRSGSASTASSTLAKCRSSCVAIRSSSTVTRYSATTSAPPDFISTVRPSGTYATWLSNAAFSQRIPGGQNNAAESVAIEKPTRGTTRSRLTP